MINLAPDHKRGLTLSHPLILAAGVVAYGESLPPSVDLSRVGAVVIGPLTAHSRAGQSGPRLAAMRGGMVLGHGDQNRGVRAAVRKFAPLWEQLPCAVIIQLADSDSHALGESLDILAETESYDAIELRIADGAPVKTIRALVEHAVARSDVPVCVRLPLARAARLAGATLAAGADALVIGETLPASLPASPPSLHFPPQTEGEEKGGAEMGTDLVQGRLYGPLLFPAMLQELTAVRARHPQAVLVASGGIYSPQMARQALALGATAIALDSVVWVDPFSVELIAAAL